jgi:hypothetical protein
MKRHTPHLDEFDEIESMDDLGDTLEGFSAVSLDTLSRMEYGYVDERVFCDFGNGDRDGLCVKDRYGCHIEGCSHADTE